MLGKEVQELEMKLDDLYAENERDTQALCEFKQKLQELCDNYDEQQERLQQQGYRILAILKAWFFKVPEHGETTLQERWRRLTDPTNMAGTS